jgi:hypothetical protein
MKAAIIVGAIVALILPAFARDDGRYAQSPLKHWFDSLTSRNGVSCCSNADGIRLEDPEWEQTPDGYRVKLDGTWRDVPDSAIVIVPNKVGFAIVWPAFDGTKTVIRCFLPGSGA